MSDTKRQIRNRTGEKDLAFKRWQLQKSAREDASKGRKPQMSWQCRCGGQLGSDNEERREREKRKRKGRAGKAGIGGGGQGQIFSKRFSVERGKEFADRHPTTLSLLLRNFFRSTV